MFRSLRVSTDYLIKISFIMDGHTLGVVDITIAAEDRYLGSFQLPRVIIYIESL